MKTYPFTIICVHKSVLHFTTYRPRECTASDYAICESFREIGTDLCNFHQSHIFIGSNGMYMRAFRSVWEWSRIVECTNCVA